MAEDSIFWQGEATGHAASADVWQAPYDHLEFSDFLATLFGSVVARGYVIPDYGNDLTVSAESPASMSIEIDTGRALVNGKLYANSALTTVTLSAADATNPRIDRIVLRTTFASQTTTVAVVEGTPAATPSLPALTQDATTYELELANVWVAAAAASIDNEEIHDVREFAPNLEAMLTSFDQANLIKNSEFLCPITARTYPPADWGLVDTPSAIATATKPSAMARGHYIQITADAANEGISQTISVKASTVYAIRVLYNVTSGDVGSIVVTDDGASPATITRNLRRAGADLEELILYTTPNDATTLTIQLLCVNNTDVVKYGQAIIKQGYLADVYPQTKPTAAITLLDEIELTADATTLLFDVPSGFKHLRIIISGRNTNATGGVISVSVDIRLNGDTGNNYDSAVALYNGTGWADIESYANSWLTCASLPNANAPANTRGTVIIDIPDYLETAVLHSIYSQGGFIRATSAPGFYVDKTTGRWTTAAAVTSITLESAADDFLAGSRISLYGYN